MKAEESEIYDFLEAFSGHYVSIEDICRGVGKENRYARDRNRTLPILRQMKRDGLVETNSVGEYRAKSAGTTTFRQNMPGRNQDLGETTIISYAKFQKPVEDPHDPEWEKQLLELNRILGIVQRTKNEVGLRRLIAHDYRGISARGAIHSKDDTIARFTSPDLVFHSLCTEEVSVRILGQSGVVSGRSIVEGTLSGREFRGRFRFTDIWVLRQGSWELVASQATPEERSSESTFLNLARRGAA